MKICVRDCVCSGLFRFFYIIMEKYNIIEMKLLVNTNFHNNIFEILYDFNSK